MLTCTLRLGWRKCLWDWLGLKAAEGTPKRKLMNVACTGHSQNREDAEQSVVCISPDGCTLIRAGV